MCLVQQEAEDEVLALVHPIDPDLSAVAQAPGMVGTVVGQGLTRAAPTDGLLTVSGTAAQAEDWYLFLAGRSDATVFRGGTFVNSYTPDVEGTQICVWLVDGERASGAAADADLVVTYTDRLRRGSGVVDGSLRRTELNMPSLNLLKLPDGFQMGDVLEYGAAPGRATTVDLATLEGYWALVAPVKIGE